MPYLDDEERSDDPYSLFIFAINAEQTKQKYITRFKGDLRFLLNLLDKAEEESNTEIEIDGDNKSEAAAAVKRIRRVRLAVIDLDKE
ncbi:MAG: hypothetical protein GEU26_09510 [Nitrososphaeraceae archaeon]|nr:hypothetical protein [Nitrososphaeraceae archaeon]